MEYVFLDANTILQTFPYNSGNTCNKATRIKRHRPCNDFSVGRKKLIPHSQMRLQNAIKLKVILYSHFIYSENINILMVGGVRIKILITMLDFY